MVIDVDETQKINTEMTGEVCGQDDLMKYLEEFEGAYGMAHGEFECIKRKAEEKIGSVGSGSVSKRFSGFDELGKKGFEPICGS
jgi:hypothetical protein